MFFINAENMSKGLISCARGSILETFSEFPTKRWKVNWWINSQLVVNHDFRVPKYQISSLESDAQENFGELTKKQFLLKGQLWSTSKVKIKVKSQPYNSPHEGLQISKEGSKLP